MDFLYPRSECFDSGLLDVGDGMQVYWEASGNPMGKPALYLHGGPGAGLKTGYRRFFNPETTLIVSFEQRGCGRSTPLITAALDQLTRFTTEHLIADIEKLRQHLSIDHWLVCGMSWATTLAIAYAQAHPQQVRALALAAVTLTTADEVHWITESMGKLFPEQWQTFVNAVSPSADQSVIEAYYTKVTSEDPRVRQAACDAWCQWEDVHVSLDPGFSPYSAFNDAQFRAIFATQVIHYWRHSGFYKDNHLLDNMTKLAAMPGILIHGRMDISSPPHTAWSLHQAWPKSELLIVEEEGHGGTKMIQALVEGIDRLQC
ncbi:prolyl aminopeptidase [Thaumasiovibrio subtropicus]|uniref:prolyl aminopeptidase n=1 Tax=Thaumasiovibrio subtropicus TaxID=1891207 RepID=UPI000B36302C|nr:prolyl aminopeptidase [Thaumasiovibrio subtropicus]